MTGALWSLKPSATIELLTGVGAQWTVVQRQQSTARIPTIGDEDLAVRNMGPVATSIVRAAPEELPLLAELGPGRRYMLLGLEEPSCGFADGYHQIWSSSLR